MYALIIIVILLYLAGDKVVVLLLYCIIVILLLVLLLLAQKLPYGWEFSDASPPDRIGFTDIRKQKLSMAMS